MADVLRQILPGRVKAERKPLRERAEQRIGKAARLGGALPAHDRDRPLIDRSGLVRDDQCRIKFHLVAQSGAVRAGAEWVVEGKAARFNLRNADTAVRAGKILAEFEDFPADDRRLRETVRQLQRIFQRIVQTPLDAGLYHNAVDDNPDGMLDILVEPDLLIEAVLISVHEHAHVACTAGALKDLLVHALPPADHRRDDLELRPLLERHDLVHHLIHRLLRDDAPAVRAVRNADAGIEQPEMIIDLRHGADRGTRVPVCRFLIDRYSRGEAGYIVDIRLLHLPQELPRVGGQRLHVAALPLGINGIESQRTLSGAGQPGHDHQLIARDIEADILEIMLPCPADADDIVLVQNLAARLILLAVCREF